MTFYYYNFKMNEDWNKIGELNTKMFNIKNGYNFMDSKDMEIDLGGDIDNIINGYLTDIIEYEKEQLFIEEDELLDNIKLNKKKREECLTIGELGEHIGSIGVSFFKSVFGLHTY